MSRGGGGGGHSSGSHSSSGGHSSSSHHSSYSGSRGSSYSGSRGSSYHSGGHADPSHYGRPMGHGYGYGPGPGFGPGPMPGRRPVTLISVLGTVVCFVIFIAILAAVFGGSNSIQKSTVEREKLSTNSCQVYSEWLYDEVGGIEDDAKVTKGLKYFYSKTGVQPYLYVTNNATSDEEISVMYDELFGDDSGHIILSFVVEGYGQDWDSYDCWFERGNAAASVFDDEAMEIFYDYLDRNWSDSSLTNSEFFEETFEKTADRIMQVTPNYTVQVIAIIAGVIIVILAFKWWKKAKEQKNIEAQQKERILNTDLNTFGNTELKDLEDKYSDE